MTSILPHGGTLIQRVVQGEEREQLLRESEKLSSLRINSWTISDLDLIGVGAFSPLQGFMNEEDYLSVISRMRLADGTVWSIPITLAVDEQQAAALRIGETVALIGNDEGWHSSSPHQTSILPFSSITEPISAPVSPR